MEGLENTDMRRVWLALAVVIIVAVGIASWLVTSWRQNPPGPGFAAPEFADIKEVVWRPFEWEDRCLRLRPDRDAEMIRRILRALTTGASPLRGQWPGVVPSLSIEFCLRDGSVRNVLVALGEPGDALFHEGGDRVSRDLWELIVELDKRIAAEVAAEERHHTPAERKPAPGG
jgi:hypothetical protein